MKSFLLFFLFLAAAPVAEEFNARVTRVVDGDTFEFEARLLNVHVERRCRMQYYNAGIRGVERKRESRPRRTSFVSSRRRTSGSAPRSGTSTGRWLCDVDTVDGASVTAAMREALAGYAGLDKYRALY